MDNIVPFIIVMAISLAGAALNKKKPRRQGPLLGPSNQGGDDFMSWINRITNDGEETGEPGYSPFETKVKSEKTEFREPAPVPVQEPAKPTRFDSYSGFIKPEETARMMMSEGIPSVYDRKRSVGSKSIETEPEVEQEFRHGRHFNLRKAVVFSEILNRKYC